MTLAGAEWMMPWVVAPGVAAVCMHAALAQTHSHVYTKKVIYCGTQNNVLLPVYITTIIHTQNQNKVVELLVAWLFTMPHVWKMFLLVMINHC
jgi:hypothetical protein